MQLSDPNNPNERKKMIAAAVLAVAAIVVLGYVFFGGSSNTPQTIKNAPVVRASPTPGPGKSPMPVVAENTEDLSALNLNLAPIGAGAEPNRNIFAFYEPPPPTPKQVIIPTPTPTPVPPVLISSLNPSMVYARTADFALEITGDKFTPALRVTVDGRELPTRFMNSQQVFTTVPAALISNPGVRQVKLMTGDNKLYSNVANINVTPPPVPNYNFVGVLLKPRGNDTAVLQKKGDKELMNVVRGDVLEGRFRVNSISEREVVLIDTTLKIRHPIPFTLDTSVGPQYRPPVRVTNVEP